MDSAMYLSQRCMFMELVENSCPPKVASVIARGTTFPRPGDPYRNTVARRADPKECIATIYPRPRFVYVAGPMRGLPQFNFPAFDQARDHLVSDGYAVISPADIDRASGFKETEDDPSFTVDLIKKFVLRDFHALYFMDARHGDAIALLPGWESSTGAYAETGLARWLTLPFICAVNGTPLRWAGYDPRQLSTSITTYIEKG